MPTSIKTICGFKDATISQDSDSTLPILAEGPSDLGHEENEYVMWIAHQLAVQYWGAAQRAKQQAIRGTMTNSLLLQLIPQKMNFALGSLPSGYVKIAIENDHL